MGQPQIAHKSQEVFSFISRSKSSKQSLQTIKESISTKSEVAFPQTSQISAVERSPDTGSSPRAPNT